MNDDLTSLSGMLDAVWSRLDQATNEQAGPARNIFLATQAKDHGASVRTVILRGADREENALTFWTNRASGKVADLTANPRAEALIWDDGTSLQVRIGLEAALSDGSPEVWASLGAGSRRNYAKWPEPGAPLSKPEDFQPEPAFEMFVVITARILWIDALYLGPDLHRRARFPDGKLTGATWIAP